MSHTTIGMGVGALLALTWITLGFWAFVFVLVAIAVGAGVGRAADGKLDFRSLVGSFRGTRSSS